MTLSRRFALRFAAIAAAAVALSLGASLALYAQRVAAMAVTYRADMSAAVEDQIRRQSEALLRAFADDVKPALIDLDRAALAQAARATLERSAALELRVYDLQGRPLATSDPTAQPTVLRAGAPEALRGVGAGQEVVRWREGSELVSGMAVCVGEACFGSVAISVDGRAATARAALLDEELAAARRGFLGTTAALGAATLLPVGLLAAAFGWRAGRRIDRSVRAAVAGLERIASGATDVAIDPRERELAELAAAVEKVASAMELALVDADDPAAAALAEMTDGLFVTRATGEVLVANPALHAMLDAEAPALVGADIRALFGVGAADEAEALAAALSAVAELALPDGRRAPVIVSARASGGNRVEARVVGVVRDAAGLSERQAEFEAAREKARAAERAKAEFLSVVSHELKTPLNGILGGAAVLAGSDLTPQQRAFVDIVQSSGRTLLSTVGDMLNLARIERGETRVEAAPTDLAAVAEEIVAAVTAAAEAKEIELFLHVQPDAPVVLTDREKLAQIGVALADNAVKFTEEGHVAIRVGAAVEAGRASISLAVADTGPGVPPEKLDSIFDSFTQSDSSPVRRHGGAGIGLAIVRKLTELLGGRIQVETAPGKGSTFTLHFDAAVDPEWSARRGGEEGAAALARPEGAPAPRPAGEEDEAPAPLRGGLRVVLAEANETNQVVLAAFLRKLGLSCHVARNGYEAMRLVRDVAPALVVMDSGMPVMTGLEAAKAIRRRESEQDLPVTPILGLAEKRDGALERCAAAGMNDAVLKPVRLEELRTKIGRWVRLEEEAEARRAAS